VLGSVLGTAPFTGTNNNGVFGLARQRREESFRNPLGVMCFFVKLPVPDRLLFLVWKNPQMKECSCTM